MIRNYQKGITRMLSAGSEHSIFLLFFSDLLLKYHEQHATVRGVLYDTIVLNYTFILISSVNMSYKSYVMNLYFVWKNINYVEK